MQALIREVAYNTLARSDRKVRHLAAARHFESLGSDELVGVLAGQYFAAQRNAGEGPEAEALAVHARLSLNAAAERAADLGSHDQAIMFLEQALTVTREASDQADLLEKAGLSADAAGRVDQAEGFLHRAVELHRQNDDRLAVVRATAALGRAMLNGTRYPAAVQLLEDAAHENRDLWPDPAVVKLSSHLVAGYAWKQYERAVALAESVLTAAEHAGDLPTIAQTLASKGSALGNLGRLREAIAIFHGAEELARANGLNRILLMALNSGGYHTGEVDPTAALKKFREGLVLSRRTGNRDFMLEFINNVGYTAFLAGDWDGALAELDGALAGDLDSHQRNSLLGNALIIRACRGESVADGLAEMNALVGDSTNPYLLVMLLDTTGNAAMAEGRLEEARAAWRRIAEISPSQAPSAIYSAAHAAIWSRDLAAVRADSEAIDATGVHGGTVEVRRATIRAAVAALEGRASDALALYREAIRGWRELRLQWDEALTAIDMVTVLDPREPEVRQVAASSREILVRLGAAPFVARLDAALERSVDVSAPTIAERGHVAGQPVTR